MGICFLAEHDQHRDCKIWPCGTKSILFFSLYLAYKRISFYIKITTYHLSFKFESQNEDRWSNFAKIFIFLLSNGVFPMLLTENTTNDTCQSNFRGAWKWRGTWTQRTKESREFRLCILCDYVNENIPSNLFISSQLSSLISSHTCYSE